MSDTHGPADRDNYAFLRRAMSAPLLERQHEIELIKAWQESEDRASLQIVVHSHLRLVASIAVRFKGFGLPQADLCQQGSIGLLEAAKRFDITRGVRFSTYSAWWIRSEIRDHVMRNWSLVRTGTTVSQKRLFFRLKQIMAEKYDAEARATNPNWTYEIARDLRVREADVEMMLGRMAGHDASLNTPYGEGGDAEWIDFIASEADTPETIVEDRQQRDLASDLISESMEYLTGREYFIIKERQLAERKVTLAELGEVLGISKERVRQVEAEALNKMRAQIAAQIDKPRERIAGPVA